MTLYAKVKRDSMKQRVLWRMWKALDSEKKKEYVEKVRARVQVPRGTKAKINKKKVQSRKGSGKTIYGRKGSAKKGSMQEGVCKTKEGSAHTKGVRH